MANLRVAHLPGRQADIAPGGDHLGARVDGVPAINVRGVGQVDGIAG
jgi:hypothetical protein